MAYAQMKSHLLSKVEAARPESNPRQGFRRVAGRQTVANTPRTSVGVRKCELVPGSSRLGSYVNGNAPKQVIQSATLVILYPKTGKIDQIDEIEADKSLIRALLEDPRSYDFGNTGWQNCRVLGDSLSEVDGGYALSLTLELTYIGAH